MQIQKILNFKAVIVPVLLVAMWLVPLPALAADDPCHPENRKSPGAALTAEQLKSCEACRSGDSAKCIENNVIVRDLNTIIKFLSGIVGVAVVAAIMLGGIQYALAGDNAEAVSKAKGRIINGFIALATFLFIFAFLQWIIPGGIFN